MHITLYRKYRSKDFNEVSGQEEIIKTIRNSLKSGKVSHAFLFSGPRGVGKTTVARLIAKGVNCLTNGMTDEPCNVCENCVAINEGSFMDLVEIDAASNRGIDEIRALKDKINYKPAKGIKKVYIIDEVHMLTKEAFNALLKTLEEPPEHAIFILATTEPEKVLPTIISRCQRYEFKIVSNSQMKERLRFIAEKENILIDDEALDIIYEASSGSMRDAISILERVCINFYETEIKRDSVEAILGITPIKKIMNFINCIKEKDKKLMVELLDEMWLESLDIELFFKDLAKVTRTLLQKKEIDLELGFDIIGTIYSTVSKFKFEEDKRLFGYVVIDNLFKMRTTNFSANATVVAKVVENQEREHKVEKVVYSTENNENKNNIREISIKEIKDNWNIILKAIKKYKISLIAFLINAKPFKIENNILTVEFTYENSFSMQQMKKNENKEIMEKALLEILGTPIKIEFEILNEIVDMKEDDENYTKKIADFFGGTVIEN